MSKYIRKHIILANTHSILIFLCVILLILPVQEAQAVSCHCFKERAFKPSQPASADPYILATARNSLLAAASGIEKGKVIRQRMTGTTETDLWLSSYLSTQVDISADKLINARDRTSSWSAAFETIELDTAKLGNVFQEARKAGEADGMARALADPVLGRTFNAGGPTLAQLRDKEANIAEAALSLYLTGQLNRTPESILSDVQAGEKTWGELFNSLGARIDTVGDLIGEAVQKQMK